jgi:hypothetical protein
VLTSKEDDAPVSRTEQAKQLLKQYGSAYLITSISFAIVSFAACYAAVNAGEQQHDAQVVHVIHVVTTSQKQRQDTTRAYQHTAAAAAAGNY